MKKQIAILIMALLIIAPVIQDVSATKTVFITTDNIVDHDFDVNLLNSIKKYIQEISGGELQVIIDNQAPAPGEGSRSMQVTSDVSINLAAADAGNFQLLSNYSTNNDKQIIFVNIGDYDLDNHSDYLRRAWDDNYSNESLAGLRAPGTFLKNAGIYYIQPAKEYPDNYHDGILSHYDDEMCKNIAQEIVDIINTHGNDTRVYSDELVVKNHISPEGMANASKALINSNDTEFTGKYGAYTGPELLYQTSAYLNGDGIDIPKKYGEPEDPMGISFMTRDSYSIYDYFKMAGIVKEYMDENGRAPDSIEYEGAHIGYYDLLYNFAKITQNHTDAKHMNFENEYHFDKVNDSVLLHVFPFVLIFFVLFVAYWGYKKIKRF
ncbi:adhesin [Methanobrevibacter sp.]|uniref:adhesin n=1 Tax=Methanobrevibacter sp. TaxID=66852 RepID=UPI0025F50DAA|nr:adhesin [Methanobrevibacter sp.]MBQ6511205.1 adhesin [Methanobrevibacter sp.]